MNIISDFISGFKEGQTWFKETIGSIINSIALTFVYFIGIGLTSFFIRISKKKLLDLEIDRKTKSYWKPLDLKVKEEEAYFRQF